MFLACAGALALAGSLWAADVKIGAERRIRLTEDWRFFRGEAAGAEQPAFDDAQWRKLNLPHDWAIEGPFDPKISPHSGALPFFGVAWYRKEFTLTGAARGRHYVIEFDGAMANSKVFLNGKEIGGRPYGYSSFALDLTPALNVEGRNVLAVRLAPEERSSRWYPGAGIYRNVWLTVTDPVHVAHWGTQVITKEDGAAALVSAKVTVRNEGNAAVDAVVQTSVLDAAGRSVAKASTPLNVPAGAEASVKPELRVDKAQRWDIDHPYLYTLVAEVVVNRKTVDRTETVFGHRTIVFDREKGFLLNGRHEKIRGVCNHHDLGALGSAVNRRATERQLEIMKGAGVNAIRTSHNPPSPELLELCDKLGLLVMDEAFDAWKRPKQRNDYGKYFDEWSERDIRDMVRRDRNHPSIIMWSIGNEIPEQSLPIGAEMARRLHNFVKEEDPTRPTTSGFNQSDNAMKNGLADVVDLPGFNYKPFQYAQIMADHPKWIIYGSETASCVSSRGVYHLPVEKYQKHDSLQLTSYDVIAPPWAYCPDPEFEAQDRFPQVLGEFVWTGFDYLGEPTPFFGMGGSQKDWPARSSYFGIVDLAGFPKDRYFLYQSVWTTKPMVHVLPHWTWSGMEGKQIPVMAYTNADEVELFLNGKSLGRRKRGVDTVTIPVGPNISKDGKYVSRYRLQWDVAYEPGTLRAVAYKAGKQVASEEVRTAGPAARVRLVADRSLLKADGEDLSFITVRVEDKDGNLVPDAANLVKFQVTGAGKLEAVDNGNAATTDSFQAAERKAFSGLALAIVRPAKAAGRIEVKATSEGLATGTAVLNAK